MMTSSSFFGGEGKHSHIQKLQSENVKILTSASIFADVGTKITVMENILHALSLDKTEPHDIMHGLSDMCMPASQASLSINDMPKILIGIACACAK